MDGSEPLVYLTYSDDGGHSYITPREASLGVIGQRKTASCGQGLVNHATGFTRYLVLHLLRLFLLVALLN